MRIFVSHSKRDMEQVNPIVSRLRDEGHEVWDDAVELNPGDNISERINEGLHDADAILFVISKNSVRSEWVHYEFTTIALRDISQKQRRIIPLRIDKTPVPSYMAERVFLDMSDDFEAGLERLSAALKSTPSEFVESRKKIKSAPDQHLINVKKLSQALRRGRLSLVCGAGVSVGAGIPAWNSLLGRLLESMIKRISKDLSLELGRDAPEEIQKRYDSSSLILGKYLKNNLGRDFPTEVRDAMYVSSSSSCPLIDGIVELARPQRDGRPLDSILTFNFDGLVEENLTKNSISNKAIYSEAVEHEPSDLPIYHVHGYLPRSGAIPTDNELVFSEDAYHNQFIDPFSWSNLVQLNKLTQNTCFMIGISLTDPNMRRLLDVAWRKNPSKTPAHFIAKLLPNSGAGEMLDEVSKLLEEQDANALGLNVIWINDYDELPAILFDVAKESRA
ncbi:TIR domain-containing protein [bacterium]|nr:TIR domain-containing protein [bacterium]